MLLATIKAIITFPAPELDQITGIDIFDRMKIRMNLELLSNLSDIMIVTNNSRNICVLKTHKYNRNTCFKSFQDNLTCTNEQRYKWHIQAFLYDVAQIDYF